MASAQKSTATITSGEVAKLLGVSPRTVAHMADDGRLPHVRLGLWRRFDPQAIQEYLKKSTFKAE